MAEQIMKFQNTTARLTLRILNILMAFILGLFCHITGQTQKKGTNFLGIASAAAESLSITPKYGIVPDYGIQPLYGVPEYGISIAQFQLTGKIMSAEINEPIENIKVTFRDSGQTSILDSAFTNKDGAYSLAVTRPIGNTVFLVKAEDIDNFSTGKFISKDTLVHALPGKTSLDFLLKQKASRIPSIKSEKLIFDISQLPEQKRSITVRYSLLNPAPVRLQVIDNLGRKIDLIDLGFQSEGFHTADWNPRISGPGMYFFSLTDGVYAVVKKIVIK